MDALPGRLARPLFYRMTVSCKPKEAFFFPLTESQSGFLEHRVFKRLLSTKKSYIFKQTCSFQLLICLSMYDLLADTSTQRVMKYFIKFHRESILIVDSLYRILFCKN